MNWLDVVLLIILCWSVFASLRRGLTREIIGLASVALALLLAIWFYGLAGSLLAPYLSSKQVSNLLGFFAVFGGVWLIGALASFVIGRILKVTGLSIVDHLLGALFGALRCILISLAIILGIMAFSARDKPPAPIVGSRIAPYVTGAAGVLTSLAPRELKDGFANSYAQVKDAWGKALGKGLRSGQSATQ